MPVIQLHIFYSRGIGYLMISRLTFTGLWIVPAHKMGVIVVKGGCRRKNILSGDDLQPWKEEVVWLQLQLPFLKSKGDGGEVEWNRSQHIFQGDSIYEQPEVCSASGQSAFEKPACCILEILRICKYLQPFYRVTAQAVSPRPDPRGALHK